MSPPVVYVVWFGFVAHLVHKEEDFHLVLPVTASASRGNWAAVFCIYLVRGKMCEVLAPGPECWAAQVLTGSLVYSAGVIEYKGKHLKDSVTR
jgi:hypothetical protein